MPAERPGAPAARPGPSFSIIVPAHDEAPLIGRTVRTLHAAARAAGWDYELIVADDASTDGTGEAARAAGARVVPAACRQIAGARNAGAAAASGEVLVFVDADTLVSEAVLRGVGRAIRERAVGGGAVVAFDEPVPAWARCVLPLWHWGSRTFRVAAGCFLFCLREAFERAGRFDETLYAAEELALSRALGRLGEFRILPQTVLTSGRKLRTHSAAEIVGASLRVALAGRRALRSRERLDLWYGPRSRER